MLFLSTRTRVTAASGMSMHDRSYTHKMGHSFIVCGCLSIVTGLILIVIGIISEVKKTTFVGIGIISLGIGCFLTTCVCLYGKLDICYNNWAYRSRVLPANIKTPQPATTGAVSNSPFDKLPAITQTGHSLVPIETQAAITVISNVEINKVDVIPSVIHGATINISDNVT